MSKKRTIDTFFASNSGAKKQKTQDEIDEKVRDRYSFGLQLFQQCLTRDRVRQQPTLHTRSQYQNYRHRSHRNSHPGQPSQAEQSMTSQISTSSTLSPSSQATPSSRSSTFSAHSFPSTGSSSKFTPRILRARSSHPTLQTARSSAAT